MRKRLANVSPAVAALNPSLFGGKAKRRTTGKTAGTKAEECAKAALEREGWTVLCQPLRLPLDAKGTYVPDLLAFRPDEPGLRVIEVKGGYRGPGYEQGYERYYRAAQTWDCPALRFELWETKGGRVLSREAWQDQPKARGTASRAEDATPELPFTED